ncbi:C1 family peptidase [Streptomyces sp. NPDC086549]|uniref:C1 family peptidase n=1 Tax=Streptomyces sp. NPDC086549 TaxID=3365752 RepID=UPI0037F4CEE7
MASVPLTVDAVRAAITQEGAAWVAESNQLTALSRDQIRRRLGYVPGPNEPSLAEREQAALRNAVSPLAMAAPAGLMPPTSYDLRNVNGQNFVTPVKDQGNCGSCVAFGVIATAEATLKVALRDADLDVNLSEAHLYFCQGRGCNDGWWADQALESLRQHGVADETCFPYSGRDLPCSNLCGSAPTRLTFIDNWRRYVTAASMKLWLTDVGPLVACFSVYEDFVSYSSGVYQHVAGDFLGGHCVSVVGFDDTLGCWICKNSWGSLWGDEGFFRIAYGNCGIDDEMWTTEGVRGWGPVNEAVFVQQSAPTAVRPGQTYDMTVTMRNTGLQTWTNGRGYRLISQNPEGSNDWGESEVLLPRAVPPWEDVTFQFTVTAPSTPTHLQWRMFRQGAGSFGTPTPDLVPAPATAALRYGAVFKLRHAVTGCALHSHPFNYGHPGSSGQQQVTCFQGADSNDLWLLKGPDGQPLDFRSGQPVQHGDVIRLEHLPTRRNLHSHAGFPSPVTAQQEVTCFGEVGVGDGNDNWRVDVDGGGTWDADRVVRLIHVPTNVALHSHAGFSDPRWTMGQQEVTGFDGRDPNDLWFASDLRAHDARFVSQSLPTNLVAGQVQQVSVTMRNLGTEPWTATNSYRLGSQSPMDNQFWGLNRVELPHPVPSGDTVTFTFSITAPAGLASVPFQWQMVQDGVEWFGDSSPRMQVRVFQQAGPTTVPDVIGMSRSAAGSAIRAADLVAKFTGSAGNRTEVDAQDPSAGVSVPPGSIVQLHMSRLD